VREKLGSQNARINVGILAHKFATFTRLIRTLTPFAKIHL
jgi:hypothetical protein